MKIIEVLRNKFVLFLFQTLILNLFVIFFRYNINLSFDIGTTLEQRAIIQFLANYTLFDSLPSLYFIYFIWILAALIPIFIYTDIKKSYSMNLLTLFFPNFFLYVFLSRYSHSYFNSFFIFHLINTILLGFVLIILSIGLSFIIKKILKSKVDQRKEDLQDIIKAGRLICPKCGVEFESIPKICYNCNTDLIMKIEDKKSKEE